LRLHLLDPEREERARERDCEICRKYWHKLDGTPVMRQGKFQPWPRGKKPDCAKCDRPLLWNQRNEMAWANYLAARECPADLERAADWLVVADELAKMQIRNGGAICPFAKSQ
jgi:hypothetical protein